MAQVGQRVYNQAGTGDLRPISIKVIGLSYKRKKDMDTIKREIIFLVCCLGFIAGCATGLTPISTYRAPISSHKIGKEPELGIVSKVEVGEAIYAEFDYIEIEQEGGQSFERARLIDGYNNSFYLGRIKIESGYLLVGYSDANGSKQYCTTTANYYDPLLGPYDIVCFFDSNDDGMFDKVRTTKMLLGSWKNISDVPYNKELVSEVTGGVKGQRIEKGFKYELLYQGVSAGTIKVAYREYSDNFARPAFYQEVNYELNSSGATTINFKGVEIEVLNASNNGISYKVTKGFRVK